MNVFTHFFLTFCTCLSTLHETGTKKLKEPFFHTTVTPYMFNK